MSIRGAFATAHAAPDWLTDALPHPSQHRKTARSLPYHKLAHAMRNCCTMGAHHVRKVHVMPRGQPLRPPEVPVLGLVVRNGALVLVCTMRDYGGVVQIVPHRVRAARLLDARSRTPVANAGRFDLRAHVEAGGVAFQLGKPIRLRILMCNDAALTLHESHLSADQRITSHDDDRDLVHATVADTLDLRGWLATYGGLIEVLAPASLRSEMAQIAREMLARYEPRAATARRRPAAAMEVVGGDERGQTSNKPRERPTSGGARLRDPRTERRPR